jgi:EPS-associated MarR family transcriptional regulator
MNKEPELEIRYRLLKLLSSEESLTQREMARHIGISLGKINGFLSDLSRKGHVLVQQNRSSGNKMKYDYLLTSEGMEEKALLAMNFLKARIKEHEKVKIQIRELMKELGTRSPIS